MSQTWVAINGIVQPQQTASFAAASYPRLFTVATIKVSRAGAAEATFQLKLDSTLQAQVYTLPAGTLSSRVLVANGGLSVPANVTPTVVVVTNGESVPGESNDGILDLVFWMEEEAMAVGSVNTWLMPTAAHVQNCFTAQDWEAFNSDTMKVGQVDFVQDIISETVNKILDAIRTGRRNSLGAAGMIPGGAMETFRTVARWRVLDRFASQPQWERAAIEAKKAADADLKEIAEGRREFAEPATADITFRPPSGAWGSARYIECDPLVVSTEPGVKPLDPHYVGADDLA